MSTKKRGLGRGLDVLLSSVSSPVAEDGGDELKDIPLSQLKPGRHQPRRHFDDAALTELAHSIMSQGVVQPIVVRPSGAGYEIIAGERRWRAAKIAGLSTVPAVVRSLDERAAMAVALVENIQRSDLNPLEESVALHKLIEECGLTHDKCAEAVGRSRVHVTNLLRLLELNEDVQQRVRQSEISLGHAKVLVGIAGPRQSSLARLVAEQHLSVRQLEALIKSDAASKSPAGKPTPSRLAQDLSQRIGLPVLLQQSDKGRGRLTVSFKSQEELNRLLKVFGA